MNAEVSSRNGAQRHIGDPGPQAHSLPLGPGSSLRDVRDDKAGAEPARSLSPKRRMPPVVIPAQTQRIWRYAPFRDEGWRRDGGQAQG